jgi:hypothetical protein
MAPSPARAADPLCLTADDADLQPARPPLALRFGITPEVAGSAGAGQGASAPVDEAKTVRALQGLAVPRRALVLRLNRLFSADGQAGIDRFAALVDRYARDGFESEVQIRYHPAPSAEGDMTAWESFVRAAVRELAPRRSVVALSVTNEVNLPLSSNTSDGAFDGALDAIPRGIVAARSEADRLGRGDLPIGFTYAWRWLPTSDLDFWRGLGARSSPAFLRALSYVGVQAYPGLVWPPLRIPGRSVGDEVVESLAVLRRCYLPLAGIGLRTDLWVSENGYSTGPGRRTGDGQAADLRSSVESVRAASGTLGVTDYRWFNLRDNLSSGSDLFAAVGLLRDDYALKPAYGAYRELIARYGADVLPPRPVCLARRARVRALAVGSARLGVRRSSLRRSLGTPARSRGRTDRWCVSGGGAVRVRYDARGRVALLAATATGYRAGAVRVGLGASGVRRVLRGERAVAPGLLVVRGSRLIVRVRRGRVSALGLATRPLLRVPARLRRELAAAGIR